MKKYFFISALFICVWTCSMLGQTPNWEWAKAESVNLPGKCLCVDAAGNSYVTGFFEWTATFGPITLTSNYTSASGENLYLVKYNPWGGVVWAQNAGGHSGNEGVAVAVDDSGNVYLTGTFGDTIIFGNTTLISAPHGDCFLVKYNSAGNVLWAEKLGTSAGNFGTDPRALTTDHSGNVFITGVFHASSVTFGSYTLNSADNGNSADIFLVKCNSSGSVLWAKMAGSTSMAIASSVTTDAAGNSYITGWFSSPSLTFDFSTISNSGNNHSFLTRYDPNGNAIWARAIGGIGPPSGGGDIANAVSANAAGYCYVTGAMWSPSITVGSYTITNSDTTGPDTPDIFLIKFAPNGTVAWATSAGEPDTYDVGNAVVADSIGNAYVTGYFGDSSITFGSITTNSVDSSGNIFVAKYNPSGNALWAKAVGGYGYEEGSSIDINPSGDCYITGYFGSPSLTFGSFVLSNPALAGQFYVAKTGEEAGINSYPNESAVSVFPNPSTGIFQLQLPNENFSKDEIEIEIYDLTGNIVSKTKLLNSRSDIDLSNQADGIYFYRVFNSDGTIGTGKLIVEK
jgi:hypothetical protein